MHRSEFTDNTVDTSPKDKTRNQVGGALNWVNFSNATINDSIFQKNIAQKGGALYVQVSCNACCPFSCLYSHPVALAQSNIYTEYKLCESLARMAVHRLLCSENSEKNEFVIYLQV